MKKIYLTAVVLAFATLGFAQQTAVIPQNMGFETATIPQSRIAAGEDTLGLLDFSATVQTTFDLGGGGYLFGTFLVDTAIQGFPATITNRAVGRGFITNDPYNVTGAMIWFALKSGVNASPADLTVSLHKVADNVSFSTAASQSEDGPGPGAELASTALAFDDIDVSAPGAPTYAMFSTPAWVDGDLAIVVDFAGLYGAQVDTVVVFNEQSGTGSADGTYSWTQQNAEVNINGQVQNIPLWLANSTYPLESDFSIFAIVEESGVGIEEQGFLNGVKMTTYPNPAVSSDVVRIQYGLENAAEKVEINVFDMNGKLMFSQVEGNRAAGIHTLDVPAGTLSAGSYVYSLEANGGRMAKQLQILK